MKAALKEFLNYRQTDNNIDASIYYAVRTFADALDETSQVPSDTGR